MFSPGQTVVIVPIPAVQPLVGGWRARLDSSAAVGVPAHVTIIYPFRRLTDQLARRWPEAPLNRPGFLIAAVGVGDVVEPAELVAGAGDPDGSAGSAALARQPGSSSSARAGPSPGAGIMAVMGLTHAVPMPSYLRWRNQPASETPAGLGGRLVAMSNPVQIVIVGGR